MAKKTSRKYEGVFEAVCYVISVLFCIYCILPFAVVIGSSFETEANFARYGFPVIPRDFTLKAYQTVLGDGQIFRAYGVTILTTAAGTLFSMFLTITMAYPLSLKKLKFRNHVNFFIYFTMLFGGGLVPTYLLITRTLGLKDNLLVLILPVAFSAWNTFLLRNFFGAIPKELSESAYVDGADDWNILWKVILPVSVPGIATISLFFALGYWNQWFNAMLYIENANLVPLQYLLMRLLRNAEAIRDMARSTGVALGEIPSNSLRMATTLIAIGPVVLFYPFVQKYFTAGLMVGSIKG
ncbi:MAG: carbohydrate ABC transporter permease [Spirochaetaceae bacterium]|jgi:multiple sugar transport system permease protein/putative aldouronate transport system permease protein|nr:carbohydrate ABC transporter permease [Spirochaetaceae bacterium]